MDDPGHSWAVDRSPPGLCLAASTFLDMPA